MLEVHYNSVGRWVASFHMGIKLTRESASNGDISVYFGKGVTQQEQVIFANYIHAHLEGSCENALRLRHYVCPHCFAMWRSATGQRQSRGGD